MKNNPLLPRLLVLYLLVITVGVFAIPLSYQTIVVLFFLAWHFIWLALCKKLTPGIFRIWWRVKFLFLFLLLFQAFLPGKVDDYYTFIPGLGWKINITGIKLALIMCGQIALVILVSHTVRVVGDEKTIIEGMRGLGMPLLMAYSLDSTLELLSGEKKNKGKKKGKKKKSISGWFKAVKNFRKVDISPFIEKVEKNLEIGKKRALLLGLEQKQAHDVGIITGIGAVMMAFKILKILPGIPFAPGFKAVFFIPLYILAADRTHSRWGATFAGSIMGLISFTNGDGRYGIFEILKHIAPGVAIDLLWPLFRRLPRKIWLFSLLGIIAAVFRTSTELLMTIALGARAEIYLFPAAKLFPNIIAGLLSGIVCLPLISKVETEKIENG